MKYELKLHHSSDGIRIFALLFLIFYSDIASVGAVSPDTIRIQVPSDLEILLELEDPNLDETLFNRLQELLEELQDTRINLNRAGVQELLMLPGVSMQLAQNLIDLRERLGLFNSPQELLKAEGMDQQTLAFITPFISLEPPYEQEKSTGSLFSGLGDNGRFEAFSRYRQTVQPTEGIVRSPVEGGYTGSAAGYWQRIRYHSRYLSVNLSQSKRPGEPLDGITGFPASSWHAAVRNRGVLRMAVVGHYTASFGQGLLLWNGGSFGKGVPTLGSVIKNERGIQPLSSAHSDHAFRGVALTTGNRFQFSAFYSNLHRTAVRHDNGTVNFPSSGSYYRTLNEISRKNSLIQETIGGRLRIETRSGLFGFTALHNRFDSPVVQGHRPYQQLLFSGKKLTGLSSDFQLQLDSLTLFGEAATTGADGKALLAGTGIRTGPSTNLIFLYRSYQKRYHSFFGSAFSEQSGHPRNERGLYLGITHRFGNRVQVQAYRDQFHFPGPRFQADQPSSGHEWFFHTNYRPRRNLTLQTLIRLKTREQETTQSDSFGREFRTLTPVSRKSYRIQAENQVNQKIRLRSRFELVRSGNPVESGYLIFQDIRFRVRPYIRLDARITFFDTDGFTSRVFQFENDLLYVMTNTMLQGQGQRVYILIHTSPFRHADLWIKAATTLYENSTSVGSGLSEIRGNRRSDLSVQIRYRF